MASAPFEYQPLTNPYAGSIAQMMLAPAQIQAAAATNIAQAQARAAEAKSQIWGQALQQTGQQIGGAIQEAASPAAQLQRIQLGEAQRRQRAAQTYAALARQYGNDPSQLAKGLTAAGFPDLASQVTTNAATLADLDLKRQGDRADLFTKQQTGLDRLIASAADRIKAGADPVTAIGLTVAQATDPNGLGLSPDQVQAALAPAMQLTHEFSVRNTALAPTDRDQIITALRSGLPPEKPIILAPGATAMDPTTHEVVGTGTAKPPTEAELAERAAKGDVAAQAALDKLHPKPPTSYQKVEGMVDGKPYIARFDPRTGQTTGPHGEPLPAGFTTSTGFMGQIMEGTDPQAIADQIIAGKFGPDLSDYTRYARDQIASVLAKRGYPLGQAIIDWKATQKYLGSMNSVRSQRMWQAATTAQHSLGVIGQLADAWQAGDFPALNKVELAAAIHGNIGGSVRATLPLGPNGEDVTKVWTPNEIATALQSQIADVTSELGQVYMGGNSPTDHALDLAAKNLNANWSNDVLRTQIGLANKNLQIRLNSIRNMPVLGASPDNPYGPKGNGDAGAQDQTGSSGNGLSYQDYLNAKKKQGGGG